MGKKLFKSLAPIAGAVLGSAIPGLGTGIGAALGSGAGTIASGGTPLQALGAAGGSYLGGQLIGAGNVGPGGTIASGLGSIGLGGVANALPASIAGNSLSSALGSFAGSSLGSSVFTPMEMPKISSPSGPAPFSPTQNPAMNIPGSLSQFSGLDPNQQSTNIATKGVYGGGEGTGENEYFLNLINRKLVDQSGNQASNLGGLAPIERSYLSQLGITGDNPYDVLKGINAYQV